MSAHDEEERRLRSAALQSGTAILLARQRAERELAAERERLRITLASIGDAVISTDAEGRVTFLNGVAETLTGWTQADAVGRPLPDVFHIVNEHTRQPVENPALRALREGVVVGLANHTILVARDGSEHPIDDSAAPMRDSSGAPVGAVLVFRDVTERKRAEEVQARLAAIVESSEDAIVSKTLDGVIRSWNAGAERIFGYAPEEAVGRPITLIIPPELLDEERAILARLRRGQRVEHFETIRVTKAGRRINISLTVSPIRDPEGTVIGASKVARDITDRRRVEDALRESEERLRKLADNLPSGFIYQIVLGPAGDRRFTYVSRGVEPLCGVTSEEVLADPARLYELILAEDADRVRAAEENAYRTGGQFDCQFRMRRGDRLVWLNCRSAPRPLLDGGAVWDGIAMDVTERVQAEEALRESELRYRRAAAEAASAAEANAKFRAFFEQGTNFAGVLALDGTVVEANRLCLDACGFTREEVIGRPFWECGWWNPSPALVEMVRTACLHAADGRVFRKETNYFVAGGAERVVDLVIAPVTDGTGRVLFVAATGTDVTERRQMEDALREADQRKDEFLALLGHELRNPLAPIRNALEVLELRGDDPVASARARAMIDRQATQLTRLVEELLDASRIARGKVRLAVERLDLGALVRTVVGDHRAGVETEGLALEVSVPPGPVWVKGDPARLAQVTTNLLNNAAKFTPRGGRVAVRLEVAGVEAVLSVSDTGVGIAADVLPSLFQAFRQVDADPARTKGGLGLGLAVVRGLVELHDGQAEAASGGRGRGATFTVRLPLSAGREPNPDAPAASDLPAVGARRVLIVEDSADAAESLRELLELKGFEVWVASTGPDGVELARRVGPGAVVCDIGLPGMTGFEVARALRGNPATAEAVLVAVSGYAQEEDRRKAREAGFDALLAKPADFRELIRLLAPPND